MKLIPVQYHTQTVTVTAVAMGVSLGRWPSGTPSRALMAVRSVEESSAARSGRVG